MGMLTVRTTPEQDQVIEEVQNLLNELAVSRILLCCVTEYQQFFSVVERKNIKLVNALKRVDELESLILNYQKSQHAFMSSVSPRIDIEPRIRLYAKSQNADYQQARKNIANILEIFNSNSSF